MSSPCISGGGRAYNFDLEIVKSPSSSWTRTSQTSSPSSTLSESSNNTTQLAISTRKLRTPRKRPNQTYNEATVLLSTAYPNVFSTKHLTNPRKFTKSHDDSSSLFCESAELLLPFRVIDSSGFLLHQPLLEEKPNSQIHSKLTNLWENRPCSSPGEIDFQPNSMEIEEIEDFDAESILDEEIEEGIDSIMGNLSVDNLENGNSTQDSCVNANNHQRNWNWNPIGLGFNQKFESGFGFRKGIERTAIRGVDNGNWWRFPTVDVIEISPKLNPKPPAPAPAPAPTPTPAAVSTKKKKKKVEKLTVIESKKAAIPLQKEKSEKPIPKLKPAGLLLKLNYEAVADAWSSRGSPFSDEIPSSDTAGSDVNARLANIDLFTEGGGLLREASVLRYKEKRRTRLFSKKIRYQVRKVNADGRPRMKGRFVRRPNSSGHRKEIDTSL
ncbi:hypothetical protein IC575_011850 [Cucumis melo]